MTVFFEKSIVNSGKNRIFTAYKSCEIRDRTPDNLQLSKNDYQKMIIILWYIEENDAHLCEQLSFITEAQKELLYAIHAEGHVQSITSSAFNKKHRLRSPSSTQTAALKLLEYDMITRQEKVYSLSDPLMSLWLDRR